MTAFHGENLLSHNYEYLVIFKRVLCQKATVAVKGLNQRRLFSVEVLEGTEIPERERRGGGEGGGGGRGGGG